MALTLMYITNDPKVALIAEKCGVNRIWVDLEVLGKEERQRNMNTVKSKHTIEDIAKVKQALKGQSELIVRVNPWNEKSEEEIEKVIASGADIVMLPMWRSAEEVEKFLKAVGGRVRTNLLLETKEAVDCVDDVLKLQGIDEIHIGLNDLHLSYKMTFMFEPLSNGLVEQLCEKFKKKQIPYGFGGVARIGEGLLSAEKIVMEHRRMGSSIAILSRSFCDTCKIKDYDEIERIFGKSMRELREWETVVDNMTEEEFAENKEKVQFCVEQIVELIKRKRND